MPRNVFPFFFFCSPEFCWISRRLLLPPEPCGRGMFWAGKAGSVGILISASPSPWKELEHSRTNSEPVTPSEDDVAEAERLKTEGTNPWSCWITRVCWELGGNLNSQAPGECLECWGGKRDDFPFHPLALLGEQPAVLDPWDFLSQKNLWGVEQSIHPSCSSFGFFLGKSGMSVDATLPPEPAPGAVFGMLCRASGMLQFPGQLSCLSH